MKLALVSDMHLEFGDWLVPECDADVLIIAGDLHTGHRGTDWLKIAMKKYEYVIYVLGNHEFYNNEYNEVREWWNQAAWYNTNLIVLDNQKFILDNVRFLGTTLWTPAITNAGLNDYTCIKYGDRLIQPWDTAKLYKEAVDWLEQELANTWNGETVVITHHAPIPECVRPHYVGDLMNVHFHCYLNDLIKYNGIKYWFHGHMHDSIDFVYENTRIICNPRGYKYYGVNKGFQDPLVLEI